MRNVYLSVSFCLLSLGSLFSQTSTPIGYQNKNAVLEMQSVSLDAPLKQDIDAIKDGTHPKAGEMYIIGINQPVDLNVGNSGVWTNENGNKVWRLKIKSANAEAISLLYSDFNLPIGGQVFVYNSDFSHKSRPYIGEENVGEKEFATEAIVGDEIIIEYTAPEYVVESPIINIEAFTYIFRSGKTFKPKNSGQNGDSDACEVNVNCSEGNNWQDQKRGVAKIIVVDGSFSGLCTGSLINNTAQDCKNYFLTAQHCGGAATTANLNQWTFYFNFESSTCADLTNSQANAVDNQTMTGCAKRAASGTISDVQKSDFMLVEITGTIPSAYNVYYLGWDRNNTAATSGVSIHHPAGDIKKISTFSSTLVNDSWTGTPGTHWRVTWAATTNGHGVTEGGSSGSPIFNQAKRVVGDLSGGSSFCNATTSPDLYGKFSYSWDLAGTTTATQLKSWIDPSSSGVTTLDGKNACNVVVAAPVANFTGTPTTVAAGNNVTFTQTCTNSPTTFAWSVTPNTGITYQSGTTAASANPVIQFSTPGLYTISLTAGNSAGSDNETKVAYITVTALAAPVTNFTANATSVLTGTNVNFTQTCTNNPTTFAWSITPNTGISFQSGTTAATGNPVIKFSTAGQYTVTLTASNAGGSDAETKTNYITVFSNAGINDYTTSEFVKVFPNPTIDVINIQFEKNAEQQISVRVTDMLGKTIAQIQKPANTSLIQIATDSWAQGIYQIEISAGNIKHIQKVIKN